MTDLILMKTTGPSAPAPEASTPSPERLVAGNPETRSWNHWTGENDRLFCGIWESTPGTVRVNYTEWEFCHFISGEAILTNEAGKSWHLKEGDAFIIPAGFRGTWETVKTVRKHYVILLEKS